MKIKEDRNTFDSFQMALLCELFGAIHREVVGQGLSTEDVQEISTNIAFNVCCAIDGSLIMKKNGRRILPLLTFAVDPNATEVISAGSTSWMHEYVHGVADAFFQNQNS